MFEKDFFFKISKIVSIKKAVTGQLKVVLNQEEKEILYKNQGGSFSWRNLTSVCLKTWI